ncbi:hypothetical protein J4Q44_G00146960 [Coregonus suidteri]|uniref:Tryptophanyl-tRNA synthetase n=1 Tax=Coregonus suidteri TaxID=861788 RepID=A0AAN8LSQ7_9TELE
MTTASQSANWLRTNTSAGNYLGALESWVSLQSQYPSVLYSIVDLHSITQSQDPALLRVNILDMAAGLWHRPRDNNPLPIQSQVSEHAELSWVLGCFISMTRLRHLPQWKMKSKQKNEGRVGLYTCRLQIDLARIFNNTYGDLFPEPPALLSSTRKVKSLRDPSSKMSKSDPQKMATVNLTDSPDDIVLKRICRTITDFTSKVTFDPEACPGVSNLVLMHAEETVGQAKGLDTGKYKLVAEAVVQRLTPIREEIERLRGDRGHLERLLAQGAHRTRELAAPILKEVRHRVGFC